jgi:NAD(P)-dependent dehydrogenase (short-subunit alcohol dehydrogenase family)
MPVLPEFSLSGRSAVFYTAGGGEGPALAQTLAEAGASVLVVARRQELVDAVLERLGDGTHSGTVSPLRSQADAEEALRAGGDRMDILVNDARSFFAKPATEISADEWDEVHSRNLRSVFLLCQAAGARMAQREYGRIVNVITGMAERGVINGAAFAASQAGLLALTRTLAVEWGRHNVRVNALGTGWTVAEDVPPEVQLEELLVRYTPLRRKGHPRDIGPLLVYLCSESCDYATGQPVYVDGGLNAHP